MPIVIHKQDFSAPSDLRPDPDNARTRSKRQEAQVAASMERFEFTNLILVDEDDRFVAGHGRLRAAQQVKLPKFRSSELALGEPPRRAADKDVGDARADEIDADDDAKKQGR